MNRLFLTFGFALALAMAAPAFAQETPPSNEGAFDALSTGGQKIVSSIYESHLDSATVSPTATISLTKDDIAALKAETGWGNVYKQLYAEGLVTHRNLGQAISSYKHQNRPPTTTVVTTGTGARIVTGDRKGKGANASSFKGGNAGSRGGGNKFGHFKNSGITTGAGGGSFGASGGSFGGGGSKGRGRGGASHKGK